MSMSAPHHTVNPPEESAVRIAIGSAVAYAASIVFVPIGLVALAFVIPADVRYVRNQARIAERYQLRQERRRQREALKAGNRIQRRYAIGAGEPWGY